MPSKPPRSNRLSFTRVDINQAEKAVLEVEHYTSAVVGATTTLRAVVGDMTLDEVLSQRERINEIIRTRLDQETGRWGIKVTNVEIREIEPPTDIQTAMTRQMSAERMRRSMVLEADGHKPTSPWQKGRSSPKSSKRKAPNRPRSSKPRATSKPLSSEHPVSPRLSSESKILPADSVETP